MNMILRLFFATNLFNLAICQNWQSNNVQCPCVLKPGTNQCLQYDNMYQATSLNEAMQNFQDLTLSDEKPNDKEGYGILTNSVSQENETACQEILLQKLAKIGLVSNHTIVKKIINATADMTCDKYRFGKPDPSVYEYGHKHDDEEDDDDDDDDSSDDDDSDEDHKKDDKKDKKDPYKKLNKKLEKAGYKNFEDLKNNVINTFYSYFENRNEPAPVETEPLKEDLLPAPLPSDVIKGKKAKKEKDRKRRKRRKRRQIVTTNNNSTIGTRYNLSCTAKGVDDGSGYLKLCSACWAWRRLPSNYFPQFVNELVCDDTDGDCLSGYATCGVGTRTFEVIRNDTGTLSVVTLTAGSYCECKVLAGSSLTSLVTGSGGALPQVPQSSTRNPPLFGRKK